MPWRDWAVHGCLVGNPSGNALVVHQHDPLRALVAVGRRGNAVAAEDRDGMSLTRASLPAAPVGNRAPPIGRHQAVSRTRSRAARSPNPSVRPRCAQPRRARHPRHRHAQLRHRRARPSRVGAAARRRPARPRASRSPARPAGCAAHATELAWISPIQLSTAPTAAAIAEARNRRSRMKATIAPSTMPASTAPSPRIFRPSYTRPALPSASAPTSPAVVPAAASALSIRPVPQDAMFGMSAATTAAAWIRGTDWNACAPISSPMYSRIGTIAGMGSTVAEQAEQAEEAQHRDEDAAGHRVARRVRRPPSIRGGRCRRRAGTAIRARNR